jgi:tetrahydromethanopterin S-methyltransferase subunit G
MMRTWKMFGLQTLLAATLATAPALATAGTENEDKDLKKVNQRLETVEKALTAIQKDIDALKNERLRVDTLRGKVNTLEEKLGRLQTTVEALKKDLPKKETVAAYPPEGMDEIKNRLTQIEKKLDQLTPATRIARAAPEVGRVALNNRYDEEMLFIVNGTPYRLAPGTSRTLTDVPAGTLTYEVVSPNWGRLRRKTTTLTAGETFNINVD